MEQTDRNDNKYGENGVISCPMIELDAIADTGQPWVGTLSYGIGQIKVYSSTHLNRQVSTVPQEESKEAY